ncbi:MAG TPA: TetR family transcriptional regulator [Acidimicrobiales bacterium]
MGNARQDLLERVMDDVAHHGMGGRSLREMAEAVGSSHRMLLYHFGSREGLVAAVVEQVEAQQRDALADAARTAPADAEPEDVVLALWHQVASEELRPFVRLFFEALASAGLEGGGRDLTSAWLEESEAVGRLLGTSTDGVDLRLGVAVVRGLLVDVVATGDTAPATDALVRYLELWRAGRPTP